jgi:quinolinate synthase
MAMNGLHNLLTVLKTGKNEIFVEETVRVNALQSTQRMLDFARDHMR